MRVEALLGAAYIAFDSDEDDRPSIHISTLIDLAYGLTRQVIAALDPSAASRSSTHRPGTIDARSNR